jgi:hypothetical protein
MQSTQHEGMFDRRTRDTIYTVVADVCYGLSLASIAGSLALWARASYESGEEKAAWERSALFVGLWPPTFAIFGNVFARQASMPEIEGPASALGSAASGAVTSPAAEQSFGGRLSGAH